MDFSPAIVAIHDHRYMAGLVALLFIAVLVGHRLSF
jgi:hypothetical protein